tara:strand:- start:5993 stop:6295 length:303 start_codon:yes stop_codon:yes gene_type:complete
MEFTTKKEEAAFYKECLKKAEAERDYEHNRYLEELMKRSELQEEVELERKRRVHWFSGSEGQMRNRVSKLSEEVEKLKKDKDWWMKKSIKLYEELPKSED